jgi:hypothetical protein
MLVPAAIITINNDISESVRSKIIIQLHIDEVLDGYVYDDLVAADPEYPNNVRRANKRLLVVRTYWERDQIASWTTVDVAIYVARGLAIIEKNLFGPPGKTWRVSELYWGKLCIFDRKYK